MSGLIRKTLYVDASNLFGGMSELLPNGQYIDFADLLPLLQTGFNGIDAVKVYGAYMGISSAVSARQRRFIKAQNEFMNSAKRASNHFGKGHISRHGKEKGVDMQLGVDMVNDAHNNRYDDAILLSGDVDFMYPIEIIKTLGKNFHLCAFASRYTQRLAYKAWRKVVIDYNSEFANNILPQVIKPPHGLKVVDITGHVATKKV